jgi:hypothetical protein
VSTATVPVVPDGMTDLRRVRTFVRSALALGVGASLAANVLHAQPTLIGRVIAAWPPLALLLTIELITRVPAHRTWLAWLRRATTTGIASIAAWVSYWHMVDVIAARGESPSAARLIPLSVDGLVIIASVCLVEIGDRMRAHTTPERADSTPDRTADGPASTKNPAAPSGSSPTPEPDTAPAAVTRRTTRTRPARAAGGSDIAAKAARLKARRPDLTQAQIAKDLGITERTLRRHLNPPAADPTSTGATASVPTTDTSEASDDQSRAA